MVTLLQSGLCKEGYRVVPGIDSTGEAAKEVFLVFFICSLLDRILEVPRCLQKPPSLNRYNVWEILDAG